MKEQDKTPEEELSEAEIICPIALQCEGSRKH